MQSPAIQFDTTPWPLKPNEIMQLSSFIAIVLRHFRQCASSCEASYLSQLQVISDCHYHPHLLTSIALRFHRLGRE